MLVKLDLYSLCDASIGPQPAQRTDDIRPDMERSKQDKPVTPSISVTVANSSTSLKRVHNGRDCMNRIARVCWNGSRHSRPPRN